MLVIRKMDRMAINKIKHVDICMKYVNPNFDVPPQILALWNARLVDLLE